MTTLTHIHVHVQVIKIPSVSCNQHRILSAGGERRRIALDQITAAEIKNNKNYQYINLNHHLQIL